MSVALNCEIKSQPQPFPKQTSKVVTVTIDENGDLLMLKSDAADVFLESAEVVTKRASHVEPTGYVTRAVFHLLRSLVKDDSVLAAWSRTWRCTWRVNTAPVGGPILRWKHTDNWRSEVFPEHIAAWQNRKEAIDNEVAFLSTWFLEHGV
jgi:hypothetical protein